MEFGIMSPWISAALLVIFFAVLQEPTFAIKKSYVVYMGEHIHGPELSDGGLTQVTMESHTQLLSSIVGSDVKAQDALIYSYRGNINGFAAFLEDGEAAEIRKSPGVVSVFEDKAKKLHTSHSWEFMLLEKDGVPLPSSLWNRAKFGEDVIIANLDTGVWPESKSFDDKGFGPVPSKWKGSCELKENNTDSICNRKLIGIKHFNKGFFSHNPSIKHNSTYQTPRDTDGHGTHTLSTAAGNPVPGASVFGFGNGTIKGGSPKARVASYKVCWPKIENSGGCYDSDIIEAFTSAINDGVNVVSLSVGGNPAPYTSDGIAIGSFHAVKEGIPVIASAGNDGPLDSSVSNVAPWILTVAASTMDREFQANVKLGDGMILKGTSLSKPLSENRLYPLISSFQAKPANVSVEDAQFCQADTLDPSKAKGKIVACLRGGNTRVEKGVEAARAGAVGFILCNDEKNGNDITADPHFVPASHISYNDGLTLFSYINLTKNPEALITPPVVLLNTKPAPRMAAFSSRGPNSVTPEILKPDITAPGVSIIASYSELASPTETPVDKRRTPYFILSGTSMSCPHVAGIVGLLKSLHPDWSPAAIRSAIMTTARTRDNTRHPTTDADKTKATPFQYGSGHIRANRAADPGLVYDATTNDYLDFLCGLKYTQEAIRGFAGSHYDCPAHYSVLDFNNPAITVPSLNGSVTVRRTLKNVGKPGTYAAKVRSPYGYTVSVEPNTLHFKKIGEEKVFKVSIKSVHPSTSSVFGHLVWSDGSHYVRSPVVVSSA